EELIANIWRDILDVDNFDLHDNFFVLGGHSLLAIQIIGRLRKLFDHEIPINALFDAPTVADLSAHIEKLLRQDLPGAILPPIVPAPRDGRLPLSLNQEHLWRLNKLMPKTHLFNMPYVYRVNGKLDICVLEKSLQEVINRHEALRTVFAEVNGCPGQIIKEAPEFRLHSINVHRESADEVAETAAGFILEERQTPFDLASGPV